MIAYALDLLSSDILHLYYTYIIINIFKTCIFSLYTYKAKHFSKKHQKIQEQTFHYIC